GATHFADLGHPRTNQHASGGDKHDLVGRFDQHGPYDLAVAGRGLDGDHALGATAMSGVFDDGSAFAVAVLGGGKHALRFVAGHKQRNDLLRFLEGHAAHATRRTAHGANVVFVETHRLAAVGEQHDVVLAIGKVGADKVVAFVKRHGNNAGLAWI